MKKLRQKTQEERVKECLNIRKQMRDMRLDILAEVEPLYAIMNHFVKDGTSAEGKIHLPDFNRDLYYVFSCHAHIMSYMRLAVIHTYRHSS